MNEKLHSCPECRETDIKISKVMRRGERFAGWRVLCLGCGRHGTTELLPENAVISWNIEAEKSHDQNHA